MQASGFGAMLNFFAASSEGMEDILEHEIRMFGIKRTVLARGGVIFETDTDVALLLTNSLRTAENVYRIQDSDDIQPSQEKFWPKARKTREIKLNDRPLYMRDYRVYNHPSSLLPTVAAGLILTTDMSKDLIDPFAGGGTIVIEDAIMHKASKSGKLPYLSAKHRILGVDINPKHLSGAIKNSKRATVQELIEFKLDDSTRISIEKPFSRMVSNPPFGVRGSKKSRVQKLYDRFVANIDRILSKKSEGIVITTEWKFFERLLTERGLRVIKRRRIRHRRLWTSAVYFSL